MAIKNWLGDLLTSGVLVQGAIALAAVGAVIYMALNGLEIPEALSGIAFTAVGFYFGTLKK